MDDKLVVALIAEAGKTDDLKTLRDLRANLRLRVFYKVQEGKDPKVEAKARDYIDSKISRLIREKVPKRT